jgi:formylglycine-generating enzyme required for sulfatase activity
MAAFEVTNGEFRRFLGAADGYDDRSNWTADGWSWRGTGASQVTARLEASHADYRRFGLDDQPLVSVTWYEAHAYCRWLTRRLGADRWVFRLPTEAEWEKAARGPDSFDYGLGSTLSEPESGLYNWKKNPGADVTLVGWADTRKAYAPNRYGLYHASGNAAEWLRSAARPVTRAQPYEEHDGRNEDEGTADRVARGGSWYSASAVRLYLAYREEFPPNLSSNDLGFRIAAVLMPRAGTTGVSGTGRTD